MKIVESEFFKLLPENRKKRVNMCIEHGITFSDLLLVESSKMNSAGSWSEMGESAYKFTDTVAHYLGCFIGRLSIKPENVLVEFVARLSESIEATAPPGYMDRLKALSRAQSEAKNAQRDGPTH